MNPQVACRFWELEKHLREPCRTVLGEIRLKGITMAETALILLLKNIMYGIYREILRREVVEVGYGWMDSAVRGLSRGRVKRAAHEPLLGGVAHCTTVQRLASCRGNGMVPVS